jgi:hypothetical protein
MKRSPAVAVLAICAATFGVVACSDGEDRSEGRYCTEVGNHLTALNTPSLATAADIDAMLDEWRAVARTAPLAIENEWTTMLATMETAATVDPNDAGSMQKVADTARAGEPAANRVIDYTFQLCQATIGDVTPVVTVGVTVPVTVPVPATVP